MQEGGDRGKSPNKTGTQPKGQRSQSLDKPGDKDVKSGVGKGARKSAHAARKAMGAATSETRKAGPRKLAARSTSKSGEKKGGAKKHTANRASTRE